VGGYFATPTLPIIRAPNIEGGRFYSVPNPAWVHFSLTRIYSTKFIETRKRIKMWKPGDIVAWRGIFNERVWHVQPTIVVKDSPEEIVLELLPGTECIAEESYPKGKKNGKRRWDFKNNDWQLLLY